MKKPTTSENIQLIGVLRALKVTQDKVAGTVAVSKTTLEKTEDWLETADIQEVLKVIDDDAIKATLKHQLHFSKEPLTSDIIERANHVNRASILAHYDRKAPEENFEENLRQHKDDLADAANDVLKILSKFESRTDLDENMGIGDVILEEYDTETRGILEKPIVIGLFTHIKNDIAELVPLSCWQDLTPKYISFGLRKKISMKAARREFKGICKVCEIWMPK